MISRWLLFIVIAVGLPLGAALDNRASKPVLYIVHSDSCQPCVVFDGVWSANREFRDALQDAFTVRELDWDVPIQQFEARQLGVTRLPSYCVLRGNRRIAMHVGFAMKPGEVPAAVEDLMQSLSVEWPRVRPPAAPQRSKSPEASAKPAREEPRQTPVDPVSAGTVDQQARDGLTKLATQTQDLQAAQKQTQKTVEQLQGDVAGVKSEVTRSGQLLSQQLENSHNSTRSEVSRITEQLRETLRETVGASKPPDISTEMNGGIASIDEPKAPTGSGWLSVLTWIGTTAVTVAAPEYSIPAGIVLTGAGFVWRWLKGRRSARKAGPGFPSEQQPASAGGCALPREYDEAVEVLQLAGREGRIPIHEALRGTMAGDEIDKLCEHTDPVTRQLGVTLRDRIAQRFNEVAPISQNPKAF